MIPLDESSGPRVYGVALGTGGRAKFPGSLFASRRWALLSAAVILLPLMGLFSAAREVLTRPLLVPTGYFSPVLSALYGELPTLPMAQ